MCLVMWYNILGKVVRILKDNDFLNELMPLPKNLNKPVPGEKLSAALDKFAAYCPEIGEYDPPPDYTEQLNKIGSNSGAANEELRALNAKLCELQAQITVSNSALAEAEKEIKALNATAESLRRELDEERRRAEKAEKKAQIIAFIIAIIGAVLSGAASVFFALHCAKGAL